MITVSDPGGSPSIVYNKGDQTVDTLDASGSTTGSPVTITRYATVTIVQVTVDSINNCVKLPASADIGDVVEIYWDDSVIGGINVVPQAGETVLGRGSSAFPLGGSGRLRKVGSTSWGSRNG